MNNKGFAITTAGLKASAAPGVPKTALPEEHQGQDECFCSCAGKEAKDLQIVQ
jgi:hypothetical protein